VKVEAKIELSPQSLEFGDVPVLNRVTRTLQIHNVGRAPLILDSVAMDAVSSPFAVVSAPQNVEAGGVGEAVVAFVPPELAQYGATLSIKSNDVDNPVLTVALTGNGLTVATMEADAALDFGVVCEGAQTVRSATLRSTGTADLIIEDVRFADGTAKEFEFVTSTKTPATVAKGSALSLAVRVVATPSSPARLEGAILVAGTDPLHRTVSIPLSASVNRAPLAVIGAVANAAPGATVTLDGAGSSDPDGNLPLSFSWALKASPIGSKSQPAPLDQSQTSLTLDLPGQYTLALTVKDSLGCASAPTFQDVLAKPAQQLLVELVWDKLEADLDLHLAPDGTDFFGPLDCYFAQGHQSPDWGNPNGGPTLDRDALTGYGPEIISYAQPLPGRYHVMAFYFSDHGAKAPQTTATVRVYEFGVVKAEQRRLLYSEGKQWRVLDIDWPSGAITPIDEVQ
jgi:hypothetical protein